MIIDMHTHFVPEHLPAMADRVGGDRWPVTQCVCGQANHKHLMISGKNFRTIEDNCWSPSSRITDMEREGVEVQVLSPMPELLSHWFEAKDTLEFSRYINDQLAEIIAADPKRFHGLGMVPIQDPEMAAKEISRLKTEFGLKGVEVGTNINGKSIGDPFFTPFFAEAQAQGIAIFIHAIHPVGNERLIGPPIMPALIGFPTENALAITSLITGGMMEKFPNLNLFISHGGGSFASILPRLTNGWETLEEIRRICPQPPSYYAKKLYYDTLVYDVPTIQHLINMLGPNQFMVGSDYPFAIREKCPGHWIDGMEIHQDLKDNLKFRNAMRFLNIDQQPC